MKDKNKWAKRTGSIALISFVFAVAANAQEKQKPQVNKKAGQNMMLPITWNFPYTTPVIKPGQINSPFDTKVAGAASLIQIDNEYLMFYWGSGKIGDCICAAKASVDSPNDWQGLGAVVRKNPQDHSIASGARWPWAVKADDGRLFLYFLGRNKGRRKMIGPGGFLPFTFCLKISDDNGKTWQKTYKDILVPEKDYEKEGLGTCCVVQVKGKFYMYYTAVSLFEPDSADSSEKDIKDLGRMGIGVAVSDDGISWHKPCKDYVVAPRLYSVEPPEFKVAKPCVIQDGDIWRMWVSSLVGRSYRIYELISRDGIHWKWQPQPRDRGVMGVGLTEAFDSKQRCYATVLKHGDEYRCWFTGNGFGASGMGYAEGLAEKGLLPGK